MANRWGNSDRLYLGGAPKSLQMGDCSHEIKRRLLLGKKAVTNIDSILKSRDITLPTKARIVKSMVFPVVMYGWENWTISRHFPLGGQSTGASASASVLPVNIQDWLVGSPCSPRDSQESSPIPQFKSINSSALSFPHIPTLTSIHDQWKNHSLD